MALIFIDNQESCSQLAIILRIPRHLIASLNWGFSPKFQWRFDSFIWEQLFSLIPSTPLKDTATTTNTLSIIASSRFLCNEISHHLYARLNHEIRFWPTHEKNSWVAIMLSSQHLNLRRNVADLKTLTRHIQGFPHHRVAENILRVSIPPSSTKVLVG